MLSRIFALFGSCSNFTSLNVDEIEALVGFGQEFAEKIVHVALAPETRGNTVDAAFRSQGSLWAKPLYLVELIAHLTAKTAAIPIRCNEGADRFPKSAMVKQI